MGQNEKVPLIGRARSEREILQWLLYVAQCPACGKVGMMVQSVEPEDGDIVAISSCTRCFAVGRYRFRPAPEWNADPPPEDPRIATTDSPSEILPETLLRRWIKESLGRLDRYPPDDRLGIDDASRKGLWGVSELRSQRRAAGSELSEEDRRAAKRFADAFVAAGGKLPAELEWARQ